MPITDPSTFAGWFDDGKTLRAYLGDRSAHTDIAVRALAMVPNAGLVAGTTRTQAGATVLQPGYNLGAPSTAPTNNLGDGRLLPPSPPAPPSTPRPSALRRPRKPQAHQAHLQPPGGGGGLDGDRGHADRRLRHGGDQRRRLVAAGQRLQVRRGRLQQPDRLASAGADRRRHGRAP